MRTTGIVRKVDELGRVVLPMELRKNLHIQIKDSLEIFVHEQQIILRKYEPCCIFCGEATNVVRFKGKNICKECIKDLPIMK